MTERKVKSLLLDSWKLFESLFRKKNEIEDELSLLAETWKICDPKLLSEGFLVIEEGGDAGRLIFSLNDFNSGKTYISEKGTKLFRNSDDELVIGDVIRVPISSVGATTDEDDLMLFSKPITPPSSRKPMDNVSQEPSLSAIFQPSIAETTLEFFSRKKITFGIPLQDEAKKIGKIIFSHNDLEPNIEYKCCHSDGVVKLCKLDSNEIRFAFYHSMPPLLTASLAPQPILNLPSFENINKPQTTSSTNNNTSTTATSTTTEQQTTDSYISSWIGLSRRRRLFEFWKRKRQHGRQAHSASNQVVHGSPKKEPRHKFEFGGYKEPTKASPMKRKQSQMMTPSDPKKLENIELDELDMMLEEEEETNWVSAQTSSLLDTPVDMLIDGVAPPPPAPPLMVPAPPPLPTPKAKDLTPRKKLRTLKWTPLPDSKLKTTVWSDIDSIADDVTSNVIGNGAINKDLEDLFSVSPLKERKPDQQANNGAMKIKEIVHILELKRANNIAILLTHFKISYAQIKRAIVSMNEDVLPLDKVYALQSMLPTEEERKSLKAYKGEMSLLGEPERFQLELMEIPQLDLRIELFIFKQELPGHLAEIQASLQCAIKACEELRGSEKFAKMLKLILALGTVLNQGTYLSSNGFKLDSLLQLVETKARNNRTTLMHYLVTLIQTKMPELLSFYKELPSVVDASQIPMDVLIPELKEINASMVKVAKEATTVKGAHKENDALSMASVLKPFYDEYKGKVEEVNRLREKFQVTFVQVAQYYGEDLDEKQSKQMFGIISQFVKAFQRVADEVGKDKRVSQQPGLDPMKTPVRQRSHTIV